MSTPDSTAQTITQSYDEVPYDSRPFPQSHPARSAALAKVFGLNPPDVATARVLELGCAAGGNLIPLAAAYPGATFVGVDLSPVQIAQGTARIAALGLTNISLRQQSILDLSADDGVFDYIICHGVYSWVPRPVRDAILRVSNENLSETGVAYLSYNVHPGWRLRGVLREAMLFHCDGMTNPAERVAAARAFLNELAGITDGAGAYGQMLRQEAKALASQQDYYIVHEYLEHINEPCYVGDFLTAARGAGLAFLSEATLSMTIAETFGPENGRRLRELSGNRLDRMEQYIDFLTGRTFRQSLLVRTTQEAAIQRNLDAARMDGLFVHGQVTLAASENETFVLQDANGRTLRTQSPFVRDCLLKLAGFAPGSVPIGALASATATGATATPDDAAALRDALFKMMMIGMVEVTSVPLAHPCVVTDKPTANALARADAAHGMTWTTNPRHEAVSLTVVQQAIVPLLDGTNDAGALVAALREKVREGAIVFQREGAPLTEEGSIETAAREHVSAALDQIARQALLAA